MRYAGSPLSVAPRIAFLFMALFLVAILGAAGCAPMATQKPAKQEKKDTLVKVPSAGSDITLDDIRHATYGVIWNEGAEQRQSSYRVSFVMKHGKLTVIEGIMGDVAATAASPADRVMGANRRDRVKDYILGSVIAAVVGETRAFEVGKTYDSAMLHPDGLPHFTFACDRMDELAGITGAHLAITSVKEKTLEMEVVLTPDFPFPLYVREHTGKEPLQIVLRGRD